MLDLLNHISDAAATVIAAVVAALGAIAALLFRRPDLQPVQVRPSRELERLAGDIGTSVQSLRDTTSHLAGQLSALTHELDKVDGMRDRVAVVEDSLRRLTTDTNTEIHTIKHDVRNMAQNWQALTQVLTHRGILSGSEDQPDTEVSS